ncbi:DUF1810 domain-containing protein [Chthoniobacter flavus]|uniref:DUF1810 domain-containing protein n=1 Tax=Chthoniobacter flavus TaxID=191863 RepID=UPI001A9DE014|nr:DUF1810 family protein [Chthoniobacter flavus]
MSLERFHQAQASQWSGYATALAETRAGRKSSHWIWYIFPQIDGLGRSSTAREYALRDLDEACAYLRDPSLRSHYEEITNAVAEHIGRGAPIEHLMGGSTDAFKLASSLTLFRAAATRLAEDKDGADFQRLAQTCDAILQRTATQGYPPCEFTLERIAE